MRGLVVVMSVAALAVSLACGGAGSPDVREPVALPSPVPADEVAVGSAAGMQDATVASQAGDAPAPSNGSTVGRAASVTAPAVTDKVEAPAPAPAPAPRPSAVGPGQIQLTTGAAIQPTVDGVPMTLTESQGFMAEVSPGTHSLEIRNLLGSMTGSAQVDVRSGRRTRYEWRRPNLTELPEVDASPMPPAFNIEELFEEAQPQPQPAPKGGKK